MLQEVGEHVPEACKDEHLRLSGARKRRSAQTSGTMFCRVSICARLTRPRGLFFYSGCGESSRMVAFAWLYPSMPNQELSMRAHRPDISRNLTQREGSPADPSMS